MKKVLIGLLVVIGLFYSCKPDNDGGGDDPNDPEVDGGGDDTADGSDDSDDGGDDGDPVDPKPLPLIVHLPQYIRIHKGDSVALQVKPVKDVEYFWSTGVVAPKIWVEPAETATFVVTAIHKDGRTAFAKVEVRVEP
jgi:hypothetical protein